MAKWECQVSKPTGRIETKGEVESWCSYVSEDVKCVRRQDLERNWIEALWLEVKLLRKQLLVCNIYRPPDAKAEWMESLQEMVEYGIQEKKPTIMMGDFNCDMLRSNSSSQTNDDDE